VDAPLFWDIVERVLKARPVQRFTVHHDDATSARRACCRRACASACGCCGHRGREPPVVARGTLFLYASKGAPTTSC